MTNPYHLRIRTSDPLSSKNTLIRIADLLFKSFIPLCWIFGANKKWLQTVSLIYSFVNSIASDLILFHHLPYYHIQTIRVCVMVQPALTLLSLLNLVAKILSLISPSIRVSFVQTTWILLAPFMIKIYYSLMQKKLISVISSNTLIMSDHYLTHRVYILNHLRKERLNSCNNMKMTSWKHLTYSGVVF